MNSTCNLDYEKTYNLIELFLIDFLKQQWKWIILLLIINIIVFPSIQILQPRVLTSAIDNILNLKKGDDIFNFYKNIKQKNSFFFIYLFLLLWIFIILGHTIKNAIDLTITPYLASHSRKLIINKTIERYKNDFKDLKVGEIIQRTQSITKIIIVFWNFIVQEFLPMFLSIMTVIIYFSLFDFQLSFLLICCVFVPYLLIFLAFNDYKYYSDLREQSMLDAWNKTTDSLNNLMNIYINNNIDQENNKINEILNMEAIHTCNLRNYENLYSHFLQFISFTFFTASIFRIFHIYKIKKISKITVISSLFILNTFLFNNNEIIWKLENSSNWFFALMSYNSDFINNIILNKKDKNIKNNINQGNIKFENISFKYNKNDTNYLFKDLTLEIKSNDKIAVLGRSGSGKSTLMKMLVDLHRPQKGKIVIDNVDIKDIDTEYLRNKVMYVNQRTLLFDKSVIYNIKYGNEQISNDKILNLIQKYELETIYQELDNGLQSNCGVNGNKLSLGMQKTTIILRAILNKCKIIIMDEPLAGIDQNTRKKIIKLIISECQNKTLIVITHDKEILPYMNKTINLQSLKRN